jgi:O-antigen/teichoic acid export membrane protein
VSIVQGITALISLPLNYYLIINIGVLGAAIGLAISSTLMAALMFGWNVINKLRYPRFNYEWIRVFSFFAVACVIYFVNEYIAVTTMSYEVIKSVTIAMLAVILTFFLLNYREKKLFLSRCKFF